MAAVCPNKSLNEWISLENIFGEFDAHRIWMMSGRDYPSVLHGSLYLYLHNQPAEATSVLEQYYPSEDISRLESRPSLTSVISGMNSEVFADSNYLKWMQDSGLSQKVGLDKVYKNDKITKDGIRFTQITVHNVDTPEQEPTTNLDIAKQNNARAKEIITRLSDRLSQKLGIEYEMISPEEAEKLLSPTKTPWKGENAFFFGGRVYFVGDNITTEQVIHEFSHPLVRAIRVGNKEAFNNLYKELVNTPEGLLLIEETVTLYPELNREEDLFKEEVIVKALSRSVELKNLGQKTSKGFAGFIKNLLYNIRQILRKVFGSKVKVEKLSPETTIEELAALLQEEDFIIDNELVTDENIAAFVRDTRKYEQGLKDVEKSVLIDNVNRFYDVISNHVRKVRENKNYAEMRKILADEIGQGDLAEIKSTLRSYQTLENKMAEVAENAEFERQRMQALILSVLRMEEMIQRVKTHLLELKSKSDKDSLYKASYYGHLTKSWKNFVEESKKGLTDSGVPESADFYQKLSNISSAIDSSDRIIESIFKPVLAEVFEEQSKNLQAHIEKAHKDIMEQLRKKDASQAELDKEVSNYNQVKLDRSKFELLLEGKLGDANFMNSYLEGYLSNNDPVINSFALFIKNTKAAAEFSAQKKVNEFLKTLEPLYKDVGFSATRFTKTNKKMIFADKDGYVDDDGTFKERIVFTFLNRFKNYKYDLEALRHKIQSAKEKQDKDALRKSVTEMKELRRKWFHQEYAPEFYEREKIFEQSDLAMEARDDRQRILDEINAVRLSISDEFSMAEAQEEIKVLLDELRQLHSLRDLGGNLKTGTELEKAQILRQYREESRKFYEWKEIPQSFETSLNNYEQQLFNQGIIGEDAKVQRAIWIRNHTRTVINERFYEVRSSILNRIKEITSQLPEDQQSKLDISAAWSDIIDTVSGFRDNDGQPVGSDMSEGRVALIKQRQEEIIQAQSQLAGLSGLTLEEVDELNDIYSKLKNKEPVSQDERDRLTELSDKRSELSLTKLERSELRSLYASLRELQSKQATDYYLDILNNWMTKLNSPKQDITRDIADEFLKDPVLEQLLASDTNFRSWFLKNHVKRERYNPDTQQKEPVWERLYVWNVIVPNNPTYYKTTKLSTGEVIKGVPTLEHYSRNIRSEFRTKKVVGETIDNTGEWLPKDIKGSPYLNEDYDRLKREDPKLFKLLETLKSYHLKFQEGLPKTSKLYLEIPRFRKDNLEYLQTTNVAKQKMSAAGSYLKSIKDYFTHAKDDAEVGLNYEQNFSLVSTDMFDNEITRIPIRGKYDLDLDQVSLDITHSMARYMFSAEKQKALIEINPLAQALSQVVSNQEDNGIKDLKKVNKYNFVNRGIITYMNKKGKGVRQAAVNNLIERELYGKTVTGVGSGSPVLNKVVNFMFSRASFQFFALNIPPALVNRWSAMYQTMLSAAAGQYLNLRDYTKGRKWSTTAAAEMSQQIYNPGPKSLKLQMLEIFDPAQGRLEEKFGEGPSRSIARDAAGLSWLYSHRKWLEIEATFQLFAGMMHHVKVEQKIGKTTKQIDYIDAWEIKDGQIQLKEGIDPEWAVGGAKFLAQRNRMHEASNQLNGSFGKFDQPEGQRYILYRFVMFLKRYFTSMFMHRFAFNTSTGGSRYNIALGEMTEGRYITSMKSGARLIKTLGGHSYYMTPGEKRALLSNGIEIITLTLMNYMLTWMFDWDPEDEERFEKLRAKSGPLGAEDFKFGGWMSNHFLYMGIKLRSENQQFVPLPGLGMQDLIAMADPTSIAKGPTIELAGQVLTDLYNLTLGVERKAYYQRDIGPYSWQKEGALKTWNRLGKALGLSGTSVDPVMQIKNFTSMQALKR